MAECQLVLALGTHTYFAIVFFATYCTKVIEFLSMLVEMIFY